MTPILVEANNGADETWLADVYIGIACGENHLVLHLKRDGRPDVRLVLDPLRDRLLAEAERLPVVLAHLGRAAAVSP